MEIISAFINLKNNVSLHTFLLICSLLPISTFGAPIIRSGNILSNSNSNNKRPVAAQLITLLKGSETNPDNIQIQITTTEATINPLESQQTPILEHERLIAKHVEEEEEQEETPEDEEDEYAASEDEEEDEYAESDPDDQYQNDEEVYEDEPEEELIPYEVHGQRDTNPVSYIDDVPVNVNVNDPRIISLGLRKVKFETENGLEKEASTEANGNVSLDDSNAEIDELEDSNFEDQEVAENEMNSEFDDVDLDYEYDDNYDED